MRPSTHGEIVSKLEWEQSQTGRGFYQRDDLPSFIYERRCNEIQAVLPLGIFSGPPSRDWMPSPG